MDDIQNSWGLGDLMLLNDHLTMTNWAANEAHQQLIDRREQFHWERSEAFVLAISLHAYAVAVDHVAQAMDMPLVGVKGRTNDVRDVLSHLDDYFHGTGDLQKAGRLTRVPPYLTVAIDEGSVTLSIGSAPSGEAGATVEATKLLGVLNRHANKLIPKLDRLLGADPGRSLRG